MARAGKDGEIAGLRQGRAGVMLSRRMALVKRI